MKTHIPLAASCLALGIAASGALAQEVSSPFATQGGLGDHIASRVLNMNGYNITNLADPFFEGDAVNLGYFNRHSGWNHKATADMDFGGFSMSNIGEVILDGSTVKGGSFEAPALSHPKITGGSLSGISMRNAAIEVPRVTGGTFEAPALLGPSIDKATMTGGEMTGTRLKGVDISDSTITGGEIGSTRLTGVEISDAAVIGKISLDGGRITGLPAPEDDADAMSRAATREMIEARIAELQATIDALAAAGAEDAGRQDEDPSADQGTADHSDAGSEVADPEEVGPVAAALPDIEAIIAGLDHLPGDLSVAGALTVDGPILGAPALFRPAPSEAEVIGILDGSDTLAALKELDAIVYNMSSGGVALGIDPETVPRQMRFVLKPSDAPGHPDSIDYVQMIGPMIATIQHMDARIRALEAQLAARN